ncbi:uncharacterized protein [Littorina saxatilis]|uniref:Uncharacterized protein n=1 Tax=Littorina saxatilis TaxID=31220 RepID=A0AAN9APT5_9CAEN
MWLHASMFILALAGTTDVTSGHEHHRQHSHFCQGGGYSLFCNTGLTLNIDKAWFGRIAADKESCLQSTNGTKLANDTIAAAAAPPSLHLAQDCGASILDSKDSWCESRDNGGCTIMVTPDLVHGREDLACPANAPKYLYLEYECLGSGGSVATPGLVLPVLLSFLGLMLSRSSF